MTDEPFVENFSAVFVGCSEIEILEILEIVIHHLFVDGFHRTGAFPDVIGSTVLTVQDVAHDIEGDATDNNVVFHLGSAT